MNNTKYKTTGFSNHRHITSNTHNFIHRSPRRTRQLSGSTASIISNGRLLGSARLLLNGTSMTIAKTHGSEATTSASLAGTRPGETRAQE